jgi:hypothetical protein
MALKEIGLQGMEWVHMAYDRCQWKAIVKVMNSCFYVVWRIS